MVSVNVFLPGNSALLLAVRDNNPEFVEDLLSHGMFHSNVISVEIFNAKNITSAIQCKTY